jgi:hypothetical protein
MAPLPRGSEPGSSSSGGARRPPLVSIFGASVLAELTTKVTLHPIDTIKARLQYFRGSQHPPTSAGVPLLSDLRALSQIYQQDAARSDLASEAAGRRCMAGALFPERWAVMY